MLSEYRNHGAATDFFWNTPGSNGVPNRIAIDKSGANKVGLNTLNDFLYLLGIPLRIEITQAKYLNNIIEQGHRCIKRLTRQMNGFKSSGAASATLAGIEVAHMIRKDQFDAKGEHSFQRFVALAT